MPAQIPGYGRRVRVRPAVFSSFTQFPAISTVDPQFRCQADGNLNRLWPGRELPGRGPNPVWRPGTALLQEHCHGLQTF